MSDEEKMWYTENSPKLGRRFNHFYQACNEETILDDKTRELLMAALACVLRCPHCVEDHVKGALEVGATKQEVSEALLIAAVEGAGTQLYWAKDVYEEYLGDDADEC
jgi:AhpD family alkylhydroperoxidase